MNEVSINKFDEMTMRLVHYFIVKEDYQPVIVGGVDKEIWLENTNKKYEVIRINYNYIHNDEQLNFDIYKTKSIVKQIYKKTLSFRAKTLNIELNMGDNVKNINEDDKIEICSIKDVDDIFSSEMLTSIFPGIKDDNVDIDNLFEFYMNVTFDINKKNEERTKKLDNIFKSKIPFITYGLIVINVLIFIIANVLKIIDISDFASNYTKVLNGEYYRLITAAFFHGGIIHLACNMYALFILGTQVENFFGKVKYLLIYFISAIGASLLSCILNGVGVPSVGASGAIFGLMGALLYFGYTYRHYLGNMLTKQLLPVLVLNLFLGFQFEYIDNYAHIGGLVAGIFASMMLGSIESENNDRLSGTITTIIYYGFLIYMMFFR